VPAFRMIAVQKHRDACIKGPYSPGIITEQIKFKSKIVSERVDELGHEHALLINPKPMSRFSVKGYNFTRSIGVPLSRKISNSILHEIFKHNNFFSRHKIIFAICFDGTWV